MLARPRLADRVFDVLAREILTGELAPHDEVPPERALAERFGVSKLLVREAIHRLAESGLVAARQGAKSRVLDPATSTDLRLLDLYYRLVPDSDFAQSLVEDILEKQYTQGLSLLEVFIRHASPSLSKTLHSIFRADADDEASFAAREERFWTSVAEGGKNRILLFEVRFWYRSLTTRPVPKERPPLAMRRAFYLELCRRLAEGDRPIEYYREVLGTTKGKR